MTRSVWILFLILSLGSRALGNPPTFFYNIDATARGKEIHTAYLKAVAGGTALYAAGGPINTQEIVIQTTSLSIQNLFGLTIPNYISNGVISNVLFMRPANNYTLFIVAYLSPNRSPPFAQYLVVGVEQITGIFYTSYNSSKTPPIPATGFSASFSGSVLPFYNIHPSSRAADIASVVTTMISQAPYTTQNPTSEVWIQTILNGPFYPNIQNGFIPNVQSISVVGNSILQILYKPLTTNNIGSVFVSAEQVQQIYYYPDRPNQ
jgi:hypothetical protein